MSNTSPKKLVTAQVAAFFVALVLVGAVAFAIGSRGAEPAVHPVAIPVTAEGLNEGQRSPIPVRVVGVDAEGNDIDQMFYLDPKGAGAELPAGSYIVTVAASPIAADGSLFSVAGAISALEVDAEGASKLASELTLRPLAALDTDEEQVEAACRAVKDSGIGGEAAAALADAARKHRDDAVAAEKRHADAIAEAKKQGLSVFTGTVRVYKNEHEGWLDVYGKDPNDPDGTSPYGSDEPCVLLLLDEPQEATVISGDPAAMGATIRCKLNNLVLVYCDSDEAWRQYDGKRVTVAVEKMRGKSDVSLGEVYTTNPRVIE